MAIPLCVLVVLTACGHATPRVAPTTSPAVPAAMASTLPADDSTRLTAALTSVDPSVVVAALTPDLAAAYIAEPRELLPAGSAIQIQSGEMLVSGDFARVPATVSGGTQAGTWLLVLQRSDDRWLLVGTEQR